MKQLIILCMVAMLFLTGCSKKDEKILDEIANEIASEIQDYKVESLEKNILSGRCYRIDFIDQFSIT